MSKAAKPWKLGEEETFSSFSGWKSNLMGHIRREEEWKQFIPDDEDHPVTWGALNSQNLLRGFTGGTAQAKVDNLNDLLAYISSYAPSFLATDIEKNCTSLEEIWQCVREYYRFGQSEVQFMKLLSITREENERPQRLYQRILSHLQDNLLQKNSKLKHNGKTVTSSEDMSPTVERLAVLRWMELIHPKIPGLVQRTFAYDLQRSTLKDLQPQIADAIGEFLREIRQEESPCDRAQASYVEEPEEEESTVLRSFVGGKGSGRGKSFRPQQQQYFRQNKPKQHTPKFPGNKNGKQCIVCKLTGKRYDHSLTECRQVCEAAIRSLTIDCEDSSTYDPCQQDE